MAQAQATPESNNEAIWRMVLTGEHPALKRGRRIYGLLPFPSSPRCKLCLAPFEGISAPLMRLLGRGRWHKSPQYCTICEKFVREYPGGAEVEVTFLFADVRGSTTLAETMRPSEFSQLMRRFYTAATRVLLRTDALVDKMVGDEVIAMYLPGLTGPDHALRAITAARQLLAATGHGDNGGPWLPVGVGVHTGLAFVGSVGSPDGVADFMALGDTVNVAARLASVAGPGEIVVSEAAYGAAGPDVGDAERRQLALKGHVQPVDARILRAASDRDRQAA